MFHLGVISLFYFFSLVPSNRQDLQTDEDVRVLGKDHWVSVHPDLINVGPDVVGVIASAEGVGSNGRNVVVLDERQPE